MSEEKSEGASLFERESANEKYPIGPDSSENAKLNELVLSLNARIQGGSAKKEKGAEDGLMELLISSELPAALKMRIRFQYLDILRRPGFALSDLVIGEQSFGEFLALGSKLDPGAETGKELRKLVDRSRDFIQERLQASIENPEARLRADVEALVASGPLRHWRVLDFFKKSWASNPPQLLDPAQVREEFNAYWLKCEEEKTQSRSVAEAYWNEKKRKAEEAELARALAERKIAEEAAAKALAERKIAEEAATKALAEKEAAEKAAAEKELAARAAAEKAAAEKKEAEEKSHAEKEAAEESLAKIVAEKKAVEEGIAKAHAEREASEKAVTKAHAEKLAAEEAAVKALAQKEVIEKSAEAKALADKAAAAKAIADKEIVKRDLAEKVVAEKAAAAKARAEKEAAEKSATKALEDKKAAEKSATKAREEKEAAEKAASESKLAEKRAAKKADAERKEVEEKAHVERVAAEKAAAKAHVERVAAEKAAVKALAQKEASEQAAAKAREDKKAAEEAAAKALADNKANEKAAAAKAIADKEAAERVLAEKVASEKAAAEKARGEKATEERAAEKARAVKAAAEIEEETRVQMPTLPKPEWDRAEQERQEDLEIEDYKKPPKEISREESEKVLKATEVHTEADRQRSAEYYQKMGLGPRFKINCEGVDFYFSIIFCPGSNLEEHHLAVIGYVQSGKKFVVRPFYLSNSHCTWRCLPNTIMPKEDKIHWFGKGHGQDSLSLPFRVQAALSEVSMYGVTPLDKFVEAFGGSARLVGRSEGTYAMEVKDRNSIDFAKDFAANRRVEGDRILGEMLTEPQKVGFVNKSDEPDFSRPIAEWEDESPLYGKVRKHVFGSKNGGLRFLFCQDSKGRAWIGSVQNWSSVTVVGVRRDPVYDFKDGTHPAYQHFSEVGNYGNRADSANHYVDFFKNYLSKIPVIQAFLIAQASDFDELLDTIQKIQGIQGSKKHYDPKELIALIDRARGDANDEDLVTERCGLREKVLRLKRAFQVSYGKPIDLLDPLQLQIGEVIWCKTKSGKEYEFQVMSKENGSIHLEGVNSGFRGDRHSIGRKMLRLGKKIEFLDGAGTSPIQELLVRKRVTLAKEEDELLDWKGPWVAIGDSNGSFEAYMSNLIQTEVVDEKGNWIAGPKKVAILGDILADRQTEGFEILEHIELLRTKAKKAGGDVVVIAGNHEDFMFSYLLGKGLADPTDWRAECEDMDEEGVRELKSMHDPLTQCAISAQGAGLLELTQFTGNKIMIEDFVEVTGANKERLSEALPAMREHPLGSRLLKEMCQMKLCEQIGSTMFIHTDPTDGILRLLIEMGPAKINIRFQQTLRKTLLEGNPYDPTHDKLFNTFLCTSNRTFANYVDGKMERELDLDPELVRELREKRGVDKIVFGHSNLGKGMRVHELEGVTFFNVDQGAGKRKGKPIDKVSGAIMEVGDDGKARVKGGTQIVDMRNIQKPNGKK